MKISNEWGQPSPQNWNDGEDNETIGCGSGTAADTEVQAAVSDAAAPTLPSQSPLIGVTSAPDQQSAPDQHTPSTPKRPTRRQRGAVATKDHIWPRHHALCLIALICDVKLGGRTARESTENPLPQLKPLSDTTFSMFAVLPSLCT